MTYYVYELVDPRCGGTFYVGKGKDSRIDAHEAEARKGRVSPKCERIRQIEECGLRVKKRKVKSFGCEQAAYDYEAGLIEDYGLSSLTNLIPGGGSARSGPTLGGDRQTVRTAALMVRHTRNLTIRSVRIMDKTMDLNPFIESCLKRLGDVLSRRGGEWVNAIAGTKNVVFDYGRP